MSFRFICRKIKTPDLKRMVTKRIIKVNTLLPRAKKRSYAFLSLEAMPAVPDNNYERGFKPTEYLKEGLPSNIMTLLKRAENSINGKLYKIREIVINKDLLKKVKINAKSRYIKRIDYFTFDIRDVNLNRSMNVFSPINTSLFENFSEVSQNIEELCKPNLRVYPCTLALSAFLFFIDHFHSFFIDLLSSNKKVKVVFKSDVSLIIKHFYWVDFKMSGSAYNMTTKKIVILKGRNEYTTAMEKVKEFADLFKQKIFEKEEYQIEPGEGLDYSLHNVGIFSFFVYILSYIHNLIDFGKLNRDMLIPKIIQINAVYSENEKKLYFTFNIISLI